MDLATSAHLSSSGASTTVDERRVADVLYFGASRSMDPRLTDGKRWVREELAKDPLDEPNDDVLLTTPQTPSEIVGLLLDSPEIKDLGREKSAGVVAEHYAGRQASDDGAGTQTVDLWVGRDGLPLRASTVRTSVNGREKLDIHYSHYSRKPAQVQAPPADQTVDKSVVFERLQESVGR